MKRALLSFGILAIAAVMFVLGAGVQQAMARRDAARTPISLMVVVVCDKPRAAVGITADGVIHDLTGAVSPDQMKAAAQKMPDGTAMALHIDGDCAPKITT